MDIEAFKDSLDDVVPPEGIGEALQALWQDANGDWDKAHELVQRGDEHSCDWVHAYLHRKEGDESNAAYWYRRAGQPVAQGPLEDEWHAIAEALLAE